MSRIIIVSYTFPPSAGIGGRRWAKFAKYFLRQNVSISVFTGPITGSNSSWTDDIKAIQNRIEIVPNPEGEALKKIPSSFVDKIRYRIALTRARRATNGNYYDATIFWGKRILDGIDNQISEGNEVIVASAGPFTYLSALVDLKKKHPNIKLVADFRDPYTSNRTAYGYDEIGARRYEFERAQELNVLRSFDAIVSVAEPMTDYFKNRLGQKAPKCFTIPNGFDPEERIQAPEKVSNTKLRVAFIGTLYNKTLSHINALSDVIKDNHAEVEFTFCGDMSNEAKVVLDQEGVTCIPSQPREAAMKHLLNSDVAMLMLTDDLTYSFSTKFCEYIQHKMPIWVISEDGPAPEFVVSNGIGRHSKPIPSEIARDLVWWKDNHDKVDYNSFDDRRFNVEYLSKEYLDILHTLSSK